MKHIRVFFWGVLFGFVMAWVILLAPVTGPKLAARAWAIEETGFNVLASLLPSVFTPGTARGMLCAIVVHFTFWVVLGGVIVWAVAVLRAKGSHEE
jgi:hypothetical protein